MPTILIVDDEPRIAAIAGDYLRHAGFSVVTAETGAAGLERMRSVRPSLVVLDLRLPDMDGIDVARALRAVSNVPIVMLTARAEESDRLLGLDAGADDYVVKPFSPRELVARVRAVLRRFSPRDTDMPAHPVSVGPLRLDPATFEVTLSGESVRLTGTELRLLEVLMRAVGQVQSRESLTERVLGRRLTPYDRSIDTHVSNLRRKLGLGENGLPEIRSIRGAGYVLIASSEARSSA
jgi:two-component system response regulator CpxR